MSTFYNPHVYTGTLLLLWAFFNQFFLLIILGFGARPCMEGGTWGLRDIFEPVCGDERLRQWRRRSLLCEPFVWLWRRDVRWLETASSSFQPFRQPQRSEFRRIHLSFLSAAHNLLAAEATDRSRSWQRNGVTDKKYSAHSWKGRIRRVLQVTSEFSPLTSKPFTDDRRTLQSACEKGS